MTFNNSIFSPSSATGPRILATPSAAAFSAPGQAHNSSPQLTWPFASGPKSIVIAVAAALFCITSTTSEAASATDKEVEALQQQLAQQQQIK